MSDPSPEYAELLGGTLDEPGVGGDRHLIIQLRRTLGRLEAGLETISDGLVITNRAGEILWCNSAFCQFADSPKLALLGMQLTTVLPETVDGTAAINRERIEATAQGTVSVLISDEPLRAVEIEWRPIPTEDPSPLVFCIRDISNWVSNRTLRRQIEALRTAHDDQQATRRELELRQLALAAQVVECPVTGLPNRRGLEQKLAEAIDNQDDRSLAVYFCDIDDFKMINDLYGHDAGDVLLVEMGRRLSAALRPTDTLARIGGDEFVVLATDLRRSSDASNLAERIRDQLEEPVVIHGDPIHLTVSIGIALSRPDAPVEQAELLRRADLAMYKSKEQRGNTITVHDDTIEHELQRQVMVRRDLQRALVNDGIEVHYQPIVDLADGTVVGYEALSRLTASDGSMIPPDEFIPVAERSAMIAPLEARVLDEALRTLARLRSAGRDVHMAVNISPTQLSRPGLADRVIGTAERLGVSTSNLVIELTETVLIEHAEQAATELSRLRSAGVTIHLDDFGTAYSSMSWLTRLPIDGVKIDRTFTANLEHDERSQKLVRAMVDLSLDLGLTVVAEGVETTDQLRVVRSRGCTLGQGYLLGRPERHVDE